MKNYVDKALQQNQFSDYDLSSVILHDGSATSGHYICFARPDVNNRPNWWLRLNDKHVSDVNVETMFEESLGSDMISRKSSKNAYILQYLRKR